MRYICLLTLLLALPVTSLAQERKAVPRSDARADARSNARAGDRQNDRANRNDRANDRQNDRANRNDRPNDRVNDRANDRFNGVGSLGLQIQQGNRLQPWWEQQRTPWWERQGPPAWERKGEPWASKKTDRPRHNQPPIVYVLPPYRYFPDDTIYGYGVSSTVSVAPPAQVVAAAPPPPPPPLPESGWLRLEVEPRHLLQVFVDGLYVGTPADLGDEFELRLGARRIELRAPGYRTLIFDTEIVPDRTIIYRGALELAPKSTASASARTDSGELRRDHAGAASGREGGPVSPAKTKIYVIPGCYMGNVEPDKTTGCDLSKLTIVSP